MNQAVTPMPSREPQISMIWTSKAKRKVIVCEGKYTVSELVPEGLDDLEEEQQKAAMTEIAKRCIEKLRKMRAADAARSER